MAYLIPHNDLKLTETPISMSLMGPLVEYYLKNLMTALFRHIMDFSRSLQILIGSLNYWRRLIAKLSGSNIS